MSVAEQILINRGIRIEDVDHYMHTTDKDILPPDMIKNINEGAKLLVKHISLEDNCLFIIDSDCDGMTSSAGLINYLYWIAPAFVSTHVDYVLHSGKQHGLNDKIEWILKKNKYRLIILPDSSSNDYDYHKMLAAAGIDCLVIDHHEADRYSEYACVINNQLCDYPTKSLSGVGMVYKFCQYLDELLGTPNRADDLLDLVALGLIGDVMDLRDFETKRLVDKGLANIRNPYIEAMIRHQEYSMKGEINPFTIAFYIAPMINAAIRSGTYEEKKLVFESMLEFKAYEQIASTKRGAKGTLETRVDQAIRTSVNVKSRQTRSRDNSLSIVENIIKQHKLLNHKILAIKLETPIDKNLTGLIANILMGKYQHPVLLLNKNVRPDGVITWDGSARNISNSKLENFREYLLDSGFFEFCEGHASAFGCSIKDENFVPFMEFADEDLKYIDFKPVYKVDFIFNNSDISSKDILEIANLKSFWGQGIEEPLIAIEGVVITDSSLTLMSKDKNPTLKIYLPNSNISLIKFKSSEQEYTLLHKDEGYYVANIVGKCAMNEYYGNVSAQILVEDYEITDESRFYF